MAEYTNADAAFKTCQSNLGKIVVGHAIPADLLAQVAIAQSNLAIAAYLRMLCQILEKK